MNIIVLGPPGSGKSTQAKLLAKDLGLSYIQMGQSVRQAAKQATLWGRRIKAQMEKGALIEDASIRHLLRKIILSEQCSKGFILDGAPRKMSQVDDIENFVQESGKNIDRVVLVKVSDRECFKRLSKRGREDDTLKVIKKRLALYHRYQDEVIDYFRQKKLLIEVDGERPIKVIAKDLKERLKA